MSTSTSRSTMTTYALAGLLLIGTIAVVAALLLRSSAPSVPENDIYTGTAYDPPREVSNFTLIGSDDQPVQLSDLRGKVVLMAFGFTHCPDYCPTTLLEFNRIYTLLGDQADQAAFLMVTVDPERDTPEVLGEYVRTFNEAFVGLSGTPEQIATVAQEYEVRYERRDLGDTYTMDHTITTFLVDQQGRLVRRFSYGTEAAIVAEQLRAQIAQGA